MTGTEAAPVAAHLDLTVVYSAEAMTRAHRGRSEASGHPSQRAIIARRTFDPVGTRA
jgi:hypothetical protein